jgi:leucyl aminopeptidase
VSIQSVTKSNVQLEINPKGANSYAVVYFLASKKSAERKNLFKKFVGMHALDHNRDKILASEKNTISFVGKTNLVWMIQKPEAKKNQHGGLLNESNYAWFRDQGASLLAQFKAQQITEADFQLIGLEEEDLRGLFVGLELATYNFLNSYKKNDSTQFQIKMTGSNDRAMQAKLKSALAKAQVEAAGVQLARHLVNLPPNEINPETIEQIVKRDLSLPKDTVKVNIWDHKKLEQEGMGLHLAVGKGAEFPPRMVHIQYRPKKKSAKKPLAFVGKGITFDTGGLDIKPSGAMRLMKKDMGGAAAVLGIAYWAIHSGYGRACDFYLALAENAVDAKAMRPSDVYKSRAGYLVEIDNTDAEGRLVLADVMDVAAKQKETPEFLIDLATLTGAIKVALGADTAGLFSNNDQLADQIEKAGQAAGEPNWRMPLVQKYFGSMSSNFADFKNSGEGFGGAITAALFLEKFCNGLKWAHLDIYSWTDKAQGPYLSAGATGQPVQAMIQWMKTIA